ncbi:MAG: hypothetical protein RMM53_10820, partial [Bacteroidia bacterium]|nr:hypothetical protein [Bacteroidia bacterium]
LWALIGVMVALGSGLFFQLTRISKILAKHEGIIAERQRRDAEAQLVQDVARIKQEIEILRRGGVESAN